jgi:hypothetical protein
VKNALKQCGKRVKNVVPHILCGSKICVVFQGTSLALF